MAVTPTKSSRKYVNDTNNPNARPHIDITSPNDNSHIYTLNEVEYIPVFRTNLTNTFQSPRQKMYAVWCKGVETSQQTMQYWQLSFISNDIKACLKNVDKYLKDPKINGQYSVYGFSNVLVGEIIPIDNFVLQV